MQFAAQSQIQSFFSLRLCSPSFSLLVLNPLMSSSVSQMDCSYLFQVRMQSFRSELGLLTLFLLHFLLFCKVVYSVLKRHLSNNVNGCMFLFSVTLKRIMQLFHNHLTFSFKQTIFLYIYLSVNFTYYFYFRALCFVLISCIKRLPFLLACSVSFIVGLWRHPSA